MQISPMRFTRIDGTAVQVDVTSAEEAKAALKELRHKKRELKFLRGALVKQMREMRPGRRRTAKSTPEKSGLGMFLDDMRWGLSSIVDSKPAAPAKARTPTQADLERDLKDLDEILHNIEGCILQIQGKLLTRG